MPNTILITGATDGIGLETAKLLCSQGHHVILHGRNVQKLARVKLEFFKKRAVDTVVADLSSLEEVSKLSQEIMTKYQSIDTLINNAGVFKSNAPLTKDELDIRFVVNAIAPYYLTKLLLPVIYNNGRIINVSSAAQSPVNIQALMGSFTPMSDMEAYSQSKLAMTMWSVLMGLSLKETGPSVITVNPGSLLGSKMVREGFGIEGKDLGIGAKILYLAAMSEKFSNRSGQYYDNDIGEFSVPHPDATDTTKCVKVMEAIQSLLPAD